MSTAIPSETGGSESTAALGSEASADPASNGPISSDSSTIVQQASSYQAISTEANPSIPPTESSSVASLDSAYPATANALSVLESAVTTATSSPNIGPSSEPTARASNDPSTETAASPDEPYGVTQPSAGPDLSIETTNALTVLSAAQISAESQPSAANDPSSQVATSVSNHLSYEPAASASNIPLSERPTSTLPIESVATDPLSLWSSSTNNGVVMSSGSAGEFYTVLPSGSGVVAGSNGVTSSFGTDTFDPGSAPITVTSGNVPTPAGSSAYNIAGTTLSAGGPAITRAGVTYSALPSGSGVVVESSGVTGTFGAGSPGHVIAENGTSSTKVQSTDTRTITSQASSADGSINVISQSSSTMIVGSSPSPTSVGTHYTLGTWMVALTICLVLLSTTR